MRALWFPLEVVGEPLVRCSWSLRDGSTFPQACWGRLPALPRPPSQRSRPPATAGAVLLTELLRNSWSPAPRVLLLPVLGHLHAYLDKGGGIPRWQVAWSPLPTVGKFQCSYRVPRGRWLKDLFKTRKKKTHTRDDDWAGEMQRLSTSAHNTTPTSRACFVEEDLLHLLVVFGLDQAMLQTAQERSWSF